MSADIATVAPHVCAEHPAAVRDVAATHDERARRRPAVVVGTRYLAVAVVALVVGALHIPHRPATLCLFRELTGLPCPFCGGTTAAVRLGHGDLLGALRASPLAVALLAGWPLYDVIKPPRWWRESRRNRVLVIVAVLVASEVWQLVRFGVITF